MARLYAEHVGIASHRIASHRIASHRPIGIGNAVRQCWSIQSYSNTLPHRRPASRCYRLRLALPSHSLESRCHRYSACHRIAKSRRLRACRASRRRQRARRRRDGPAAPPYARMDSTGYLPAGVPRLVAPVLRVSPQHCSTRVSVPWVSGWPSSSPEESVRQAARAVLQQYRAHYGHLRRRSGRHEVHFGWTRPCAA